MGELVPTETKALSACSSQSPEMILWAEGEGRVERAVAEKP